MILKTQDVNSTDDNKETQLIYKAALYNVSIAFAKEIT